MALILDGTNGLSDVDGSAATPAIRGSDANTGIFFPAADTIAFAEGGVESARFDSSGNLGIGTSSPAEKLHVNSGTGNVPLLLESTDAIALAQFKDNSSTTFNAVGAQANALVFYNDTERARIDSSGNLLVGTTDAVGRLTVNRTSGNWAASFQGANALGGILIGNQSGTSTYDALVFTHSGFGTQTGSITVNSNGTTSYVTSSDYRLKHDIQPMTGALARVASLKPCTYKWNADNSQSEGFIAHELQEVVPECVTGEKDAVDADGKPVYQGIDTSFLVATLTAAIQELKGINDAQAQIITALTARVEALEGAQA